MKTKILFIALLSLISLSSGFAEEGQVATPQGADDCSGERVAEGAEVTGTTEGTTGSDADGNQ